MVKTEIKDKVEKENNIRYGDAVINKGDLYFAIPCKGNIIFMTFRPDGGTNIWSSEGISTFVSFVSFDDVKNHFNNNDELEYIPREKINMTIKVNR